MPERIAIVGDLALSESKLSFPASLDFKRIIVNLEGPLLDHGAKSKGAVKAGPHVFNSLGFGDERLADLSSWIFSAANNHMMDFGESGYLQTLACINEHNSTLIGVGSDLQSSRSDHIIQIDGVFISLISCSQKTFRVSTPQGPGIAEVGDWVFEKISENVKKGLETIVFHHGGTEDFSLPSPGIVERYRSWIDAGARLIVGTHPHVVQPFEKYKRGEIFYGLGNFAVEPSKWQSSDGRNQVSLMLTVEVVEGKLQVSSRFITCEVPINSKTVAVRPVEGQDVRSFLKSMHPILNNPLLHAKVWQEYSVEIYRKFYRRQIIIATFSELVFHFLPKSARIRFGFLNRPFLFDLIAWDDNREVIEQSLGMKHGHIIDIRDKGSRKIWRQIKAMEELVWFAEN